MKTLLFITLLLLTSCSNKYKGFYQTLGKLDCDCATALEKSIHHYENPQRDSSLDIDFDKTYDKAFDIFSKYAMSHRNKAEEIQSSFTEEEIILEYNKGYAPCNCDTCLFRHDNVEITSPIKKVIGL